METKIRTTRMIKAKERRRKKEKKKKPMKERTMKVKKIAEK